MTCKHVRMIMRCSACFAQAWLQESHGEALLYFCQQVVRQQSLCHSCVDPARPAVARMQDGALEALKRLTTAEANDGIEVVIHT